jgi:MarR family transcriptional regulator, 2-MHQ and catechol-resistance regulon repressor
MLNDMRLNYMGTAHKGNEQEVKALNAYIKLMRAAETVTSRLNRNLASADLTVSQFGVLEALFHKGPLCQRDIAAKILKSTGNITMVIDNLEKRGLVRRERAAEDRRYITISLTEKGSQLIEKLFPRHAAAITDEIGVLTEEEQAELGRLCRKLGLKEKGVKAG